MRTRTISDSNPRLYMHAPSLCLAETITSLIETKTIADIHFARGRSSRDERSAGSLRRVAARTAVDYRRFIARKSSASSPLLLVGSRKRSKSEGRSSRSIYQNASGCAASSPSKRSLRVHTTTKLFSCWRIRYPVLSRTRRCAYPFLFTTQHPRKGTWGSAVYLHGDTEARVYVRTHAFPQPSL